MGYDIDTMNIEDFVFFKVELIDTNSAKLIGQTTNYCFRTECELPKFRSIY